MEITYSRKVKFLEDARATKREFPNEWKMILRRKEELERAPTVRDLHYGNPHPLKGNMQGLMSVTVQGGLRIVFGPAKADSQYGQKQINWSLVTKVCIKDIVDYH